jgi:hypothetical protein
MLRVKKLFASLCATGLLGLVGVAPAAAQPQTGLVNVDIDITDNVVNVQVPIGVAANVCGINAAVIAADFTQTTNPVCEADVTQLPIAFQPQ